jgi:hypothetical protein
MPGYLLDAGTAIMCPHGGSGAPSPRSVRVKLGGKPPLLADDLVTIAGCAFNVSGAPSPCLRVQWLMPATRVKIEGSPALLSSSVGLCLNAGGAPQGTAVLSGYQTRVRGQ